MTGAAILIGGLLVVLVVTNLYWRRRLAAARDGLRHTIEWEATGATTKDPTGTVDPSLQLAVKEAAETAGVPVEELPERVETYEKQRRKRGKEIERLREAWVDSWWAVAERSLPRNEPRVVTVGIDAGGHEVVRAFAIHALETDDEIVLGYDRSSGAFAVGVSEGFDHWSAAEIAGDIVEHAPSGGGGGHQQLATGKIPPDAVADAVEAVSTELEPQVSTPMAPAD